MPRPPLPTVGGDSRTWGEKANAVFEDLQEAADRVDPGSTGSTGQSLRIVDGAPAWHPDTVVDVAWYGVSTANSGADNTAALNALFAAIAAGSEARRVVRFGECGTYEVDGTVTVNCARITIVGQGRQATIIEQQAADVPVLLWDDEGAGDRSSIAVRDLGLANANAPTAGTTQQYGIQFRATSDGTGGAGYGYYLLSFDSLYLRNLYTAIGQYTVSSGKCPLWAASLTRLYLRDVLRPLWLQSDGTGGQPNIVLDTIDILNYGAVVNAAGDAAIRLKAANGLSIRNVNVEGWIGRAIQIFGGSGATIDSPRFEHHVFNSASPSLLLLSDGAYSVRNLVAAFATFDPSGIGAILELGSGTHLTVQGIHLSTTDGSPSGNTQLFRASSPGTTRVVYGGYANGIGSQMREYMPDGWGEGGRHARVAKDGMVPAVDTLPTASADYRGRMFRIEGGSGVADVTYICAKDAANAYNWDPIH